MTAAENCIPYKRGRWNGLIHKDFQPVFSNFNTWLPIQKQEAVVDKPTRQVLRVTSADGVFYVKTVSTLAEGKHTFQDLLKKLKWYIRPSRALRTMKIMNAMLDAGIRCPEPILAIRSRPSLLALPQDIIVTREVNSPIFLNVLIDTKPELRCALLENATPDLFAFHEAGFIHGDFLPGNMLWDGAHIYFIDHDRSSCIRPDTLSHQRLRNIRQFCHQLLRFNNGNQILQAFLTKYNELSTAKHGKQAADPTQITDCVTARFRRDNTSMLE